MVSVRKYANDYRNKSCSCSTFYANLCTKIKCKYLGTKSFMSINYTIPSYNKLQ